jgi:hypothetical protein
MKFKKLISSLAVIAVSASFVFGQLPKKNPTEDPAALKKEAVAFLRETMVDVNNLRTLENRISFSAELAGLMWFHDEKEARSLYITAFGNFKELLMQYDLHMNSFGEPEEGDEELLHRRSPFSGGDLTDKAKLARRFQIAMQVRQQIAMSLAEHDADLAFNFYYESIATLSNPLFRKQMEDRDKYFEAQLMTQIAQTSPEKAAKFAARSVQDGLNYHHIELLKKIHAKDPEKGAELASAMLGKIKSDKKGASDFWVTSTFLNVAGESYEKSRAEGGKRAMLDRDGLRDLAETFGQAILDNESEHMNGMQYVSEIEKYSPSRAIQIRAKFKAESGQRDPNRFTVRGDSGFAPPPPPPPAYKGPVNTSGSASPGSERQERERLEREKAEKELKENVEKLSGKQVPKEEREKIVAQARRIVMATPGKDKKILGLSTLAAQVAKFGDKELAAEIMKEAQALVNPVPKTYQDFLLTWMLATGYAESDPDKAFPLLEETIMRANDTLAAFIKVGEFIDVAGEMIDDGEVQVGAFGGQMVRGLTSELGMAESTLRTLAKADFKKTRDLTNRFERSEVRILAKMMILRAVLGEGKEAKKEAEVSEGN